jgi:hypothetical protein
MIGVSCERVYQFKNKDRMSLGLEWRYSLDSYSFQELVVWPLTSEANAIQREPHFMWLGLRMGYIFTTAPSRYPKWMRLREERGLAAP